MIKLYSYFRSSGSYRVRIALNLKALDYKIQPIHLLHKGGEQFKEEFKKLNPACRVPVLVHGDLVISQSMAIIEYLDERFPRPNLYPKDFAQRAKVRQLCENINSDIQPLQNLSVLKKLVKDSHWDEKQKLHWIRHWIELGFQSFESLVAKISGKFCLGDQPGSADCFLIPQVYNALRFGVDLSPFPHIKGIHQRATELEAFRKAHPDEQPDFPKNE